MQLRCLGKTLCPSLVFLLWRSFQKNKQLSVCHYTDVNDKIILQSFNKRWLFRGNMILWDLSRNVKGFSYWCFIKLQHWTAIQKPTKVVCIEQKEVFAIVWLFSKGLCLEASLSFFVHLEIHRVYFPPFALRTS